MIRRAMSASFSCTSCVDATGRWNRMRSFAYCVASVKHAIAATQAVQLKLADMARRITLAQLLSLQLGRLKDAGKMQPTQVSLAKWNNCRMAIDIAREARDILGGAGITTEHCPIRHALNLESVITYEGTESVHQLVVGREVTGINAF